MDIQLDPNDVGGTPTETERALARVSQLQAWAGVDVRPTPRYRRGHDLASASVKLGAAGLLMMLLGYCK